MPGVIDGCHSAEDWSSRGGRLCRQAGQVNFNSFKLLPTNLVNFPAIEQSLVRACEFGRRSKVEGVPVSWPMIGFARESCTKTDNTYVRPWETQVQQKNAIFSVGREPLWQLKKAAFSAGHNKNQEQFIQKN